MRGRHTRQDPQRFPRSGPGCAGTLRLPEACGADEVHAGASQWVRGDGRRRVACAGAPAAARRHDEAAGRTAVDGRCAGCAGLPEQGQSTGPGGRWWHPVLGLPRQSFNLSMSGMRPVPTMRRAPRHSTTRTQAALCASGFVEARRAIRHRNSQRARHATRAISWRVVGYRVVLPCLAEECESLVDARENR